MTDDLQAKNEEITVDYLNALIKMDEGELVLLSEAIAELLPHLDNIPPLRADGEGAKHLANTKHDLALLREHIGKLYIHKGLNRIFKKGAGGADE